MWRVAARWIVFGLGLSLSACLPNLPGLVRPASPSAVKSLASSPASQGTFSATSLPTASASPMHLVNSGTSFTAIPSFTATLAPGSTVAITDTPSAIALPVTATMLDSISLDKLPESTVYKRVRIQNQSRSQMDISLHCTTVKGLQTVLEYNNVRNLSIQAPDGDYIYVIYVGGRQMTGGFTLLTVPSLTITVYSDRVAIH